MNIKSLKSKILLLGIIFMLVGTTVGLNGVKTNGTRQLTMITDVSGWG